MLPNSSSFFTKLRVSFGSLGRPSPKFYSSEPFVLSHALPSQQTNRKYFLEKSKVVQAKALLKENPVEWTPTKLAQHFDVPVSLIEAHVPLPSRHKLRTFRLLNREFSTPYKDRAKRPNVDVLDNWIQNQMNKVPEAKAKRKYWKATAQKEIDNIDMVWLLQLEKKMGLLQEKAVIQLDQERKERREKGGAPEKSGKLEKKAKG